MIGKASRALGALNNSLLGDLIGAASLFAILVAILFVTP